MQKLSVLTNILNLYKQVGQKKMNITLFICSGSQGPAAEKGQGGQGSKKMGPILPVLNTNPDHFRLLKECVNLVVLRRPKVIQRAHPCLGSKLHIWCQLLSTALICVDWSIIMSVEPTKPDHCEPWIDLAPQGKVWQPLLATRMV